MQDLIKEITAVFGPSGSEEKIREVIKNKISDYVDEVETDKLGNLIAYKKGNGQGKRIMLAAHMDQIGLLVTHIDDDGFLRFTNIGGVKPHRLIGQRFIFADGTVGTVGVEKVDEEKDIKLDKLYLDIGASSKDEATKRARIGDSVVYYPQFNLSGNRIISSYLDDRIGCIVLIKVLEELKESPHDIYFVFTVQEEVGLRGARTAAYKIEPDLAIAVDVTATGDTPKAPTMAVSLGDGAAIKIKDSASITHPMIKELLISTAEKYNIKYQLEVLERGGTDAGSIHLTKGGIPSGTVSIPTRYIHSPAEMADLGDVEESIRLLTKLLEEEIE
ncbi:MAG: hypothetical protein PWR10_197 [Halanaerobiales bacterium]|nr:hypothetical protein [Halanaerobiales bacterium]